MADVMHGPRSGSGGGGAPTPLTRRRFIQAVAALGGTTAAWSGLSAWGQIAEAKQVAPPKLEGDVNGARVVVLGAGPAGLVAGHELAKRGYEVQVLEADERVGGHVFTARRGRRTRELGREEQVCDFDEGQWFDAGAWRIPSMHHGVQHYLKEFQIPTIHHTDINMSAYVYLEDIRGPLANRPVRIREAYMDMTGYAAELLAKAIDQDLLDLELTQDDRDAFIEYLVSVGLLSNDDLSYGPNIARGWSALNGGGFSQNVPTEPYALLDILPVAGAVGDFTPLTNLLHQPVMLKPAKGMSQIFEEGFQVALGERLHLEAEVQEIRQSEDGVEIVYRDKPTGEMRTVAADYCVSTIPLSIVNTLQADLSSSTREAIQGCAYNGVGKLGLQFKRRFWEEDDGIYGGITSTNIPQIGGISYPTWDYHTQKGVLQSYYNFGNNAISVSNLSYQDRIELALEHGSKIHPQYREEYDGKGFSVSWHLMPYAKGGWAGWSPYARQNYYPRMMEPDGRIYFAGDFLSYVAGWMEGAIEAAWLQVENLHTRVMQGG